MPCDDRHAAIGKPTAGPHIQFLEVRKGRQQVQVLVLGLRAERELLEVLWTRQADQTRSVRTCSFKIQEFKIVQVGQEFEAIIRDTGRPESQFSAPSLWPVVTGRDY